MLLFSTKLLSPSGQVVCHQVNTDVARKGFEDVEVQPLQFWSCGRIIIQLAAVSGTSSSRSLK